MPLTQSVVLSCAGIGSRLGLGQTKALLKIGGKTLIQWHLETFKDVEDLRVVIGYQGSDVIKEVLKYRQDVIFVYNHEYFHTQEGTSYYLGGKDANDLVIAWDGDLLVHPEDARVLLSLDEEYIAYSDKRSDEAVYLSVDSGNHVVAFSPEAGDFEWTGPCCLKKKDLVWNTGFVYNLLEPLLPLKGVKIRAQNIDVYNDYRQAEAFIKGW